ncbi:hypothetical protein FHJ31_26225 [Pseudomonas sp. Fig-3]|nr:hypothetical protein FHJ31_26225 [Pseudomonas sp. Fig-3]
MGAGLLAKAVGQLASMLNEPAPSRAGSLPQGDLCRIQNLIHWISLVGASLLAMASVQPTEVMANKHRFQTSDSEGNLNEPTDPTPGARHCRARQFGHQVAIAANAPHRR